MTIGDREHYNVGNYVFPEVLLNNGKRYYSPHANPVLTSYQGQMRVGLLLQINQMAVEVLLSHVVYSNKKKKTLLLNIKSHSHRL